MKKANEWTRDEFTQWGLVNAHLEPWGTVRARLGYQLCEVRMISPDYMQFLALPEAWTPGTNGPLRGEVTQVIASTAADLEKYRGQVGGQDRVVSAKPACPTPATSRFSTVTTPKSSARSRSSNAPHFPAPRPVLAARLARVAGR